MQSEQLLGARWYAIGTGSWADKTTPPGEAVTQTALTVEYARRRITRSAYLVVDNLTGTIPYGGNLCKEVPDPTPLVAFYTSSSRAKPRGLGSVKKASSATR